MKAYLFDDHMVEIDPRAAEIGGSFQARKNGLPAAWDEKTLKFFYEQTARVENPVVLDIGANTGSFTLLATLHKGMKVFAFEPNHYAAESLLTSAVMNNVYHKLSFFHSALSDKNEEAYLKIPNGQSGLSTLADNPTRFRPVTKIEVKVYSLDYVCADAGIKKVDFIKVDTEGHELFVLRGGEKTIRENKPQMLLEYYAPNTRQFGYEPHEITDLLESWGAKWEQVSNEDIWVMWE